MTNVIVNWLLICSKAIALTTHIFSRNIIIILKRVELQG